MGPVFPDLTVKINCDDYKNRDKGDEWNAFNVGSGAGNVQMEISWPEAKSSPFVVRTLIPHNVDSPP